ncbi:AEC family transporter [Fructilactobacillus fructivorans]|uniref:AEC family transporter n=1 Tax=Fructilactobacillus fructivorans TaxID=1614 RepID=UPI000704CA85|nr:AEC family transporter [Fructilactobacillus fructivorans]KRN42212.1 L-malate uniport protein [Fructilactobacillus fructivorans]
MTAFIASLESVAEIVIIIALGYFIRRSGKMTDGFKGNVSFLIMNIALPVSIFISVLDNLNRGKLVGLAGGLLYTLISFTLGYLIAILLVFVLRIKKGRRGAFINMSVNANTIFMGLPLNIALFGNSGMTYFLVYYVMNTVSTWAIGIFFISGDDPTKQKGDSKKKLSLKQILPPPLIGFILGLAWIVIINVKLPMWIDKTCNMIGGLVTPLALIYIGIILADAGLSSIHFDKDTIAGLVGRFVIAPAIMIGTLLVFMHSGISVTYPEFGTLVIQSATPELTVLPILVSQAHGDVDYATNLVVTSTVLFVVVVPILMEVINFIV